MKLRTATRWTIVCTAVWIPACVIGIVLVTSLLALAAGPAPDKKPEPALAIDSGSFGIFIRNQRVATETFRIEQQNGASIIKSQLKEAPGVEPTNQKSDLEITPKGELLHYEWSQASGGSLTVFPENEFLKERITTASSTKAAEQSFLMPSTSAILDNNFFIHREVLAWRYLSSACKPEGGNMKCQKNPAEFGTLVPQDRTSLPVRMEVVGKEKITIHGAQRELLHLKLTGESFEWGLWLDDQDHYKLIRVAIPADDTEVVRD